MIVLPQVQEALQGSDRAGVGEQVPLSCARHRLQNRRTASNRGPEHPLVQKRGPGTRGLLREHERMWEGVYGLSEARTPGLRNQSVGGLSQARTPGLRNQSVGGLSQARTPGLRNQSVGMYGLSQARNPGLRLRHQSVGEHKRVREGVYGLSEARTPGLRNQSVSSGDRDSRVRTARRCVCGMVPGIRHRRRPTSMGWPDLQEAV